MAGPKGGKKGRERNEKGGERRGDGPLGLGPAGPTEKRRMEFFCPNIFLFSFLNSNQILKHDPNRIPT